LHCILDVRVKSPVMRYACDIMKAWINDPADQVISFMRKYAQ
jgi:hypothetical protein